MDETTRARQDAVRQELGRQGAVRQEAFISAAMNVAIGLGFFMLVFGWHRSATTSLAIDFLPQTIGMTFLGGMASSLICLAKVSKGSIVPAGPVPSRISQAVRVFGCAAAVTPVFGGAAALLLLALAPSQLDPLTAVTIKSLYGIVMAFIVTPPIVRMALGMPFWPRRSATITALSL